MLSNLCKFRDPSSSSHHLHYTAKRKIRGNVIFWKKKKSFVFLNISIEISLTYQMYPIKIKDNLMLDICIHCEIHKSTTKSRICP